MVRTQEENQIIVYKSFDTILKGINSRNLFVFDFDELLVIGHLSRDVSHAVQSKDFRDRVLEQYPDYTFEALERLNVGVLEGVDYEKALKRKRKVVDEMPWRNGAAELLRKIIHNRDYSALVISCGRYTPIRMKLDSSDLEQIPLIGTEVAYSDSKPISKHIITPDLKGKFITLARQRKGFRRIIAVGHSGGDIPMIENADLGVALAEDPANTKVETAADCVIDDLFELYSILDFKG